MPALPPVPPPPPPAGRPGPPGGGLHPWPAPGGGVPWPAAPFPSSTALPPGWPAAPPDPRQVRTVVVIVVCVVLVLTGGVLALAFTARPTSTLISAGQPRTIAPLALPPVLFADAPPGSPSLVTPGMAATVARTMWSLRQRALAEGNNDGIRQLDVPGGPLAASDLTACGCSRENVPTTYSSLVTLVPTETAYPLDFLAQYQSSIQLQANFNGGSLHRGPWDVIEVLTKADAAASWHVAFATGFSNAHASADIVPFHPPPGTGAYDDTATIEPPVAVDQLPPLLAAYWQSFKDTGHAPVGTPFLTGSDSSAFGDYLAESPQETKLPGHSQVTFAYSADPSRDGIWSFPVRPGDDLVTCSTVQVVATYRPDGAASTIVQGQDRFFGAGLAPGRYTKIEETTVHESCILTASNGLAVFGTEGYDTSDVGTAAGR